MALMTLVIENPTISRFYNSESAWGRRSKYRIFRGLFLLRAAATLPLLTNCRGAAVDQLEYPAAIRQRCGELAGWITRESVRLRPTQKNFVFSQYINVPS